MAGLRTKRRRVRQQHPDVLTAIHEAVMTRASARQIAESLTQKQARGELPPLSIPSTRTISNIARDMASDDSGEWRLEDANSSDVRLVLDVLREVIEHSEGRIQSLTKREAALIPIIFRAASPRLTGWATYKYARFYLYWVAREQSDRDFVSWFAFIEGDQQRYRDAVRNGWVDGRGRYRILDEIGTWISEEVGS